MTLSAYVSSSLPYDPNTLSYSHEGYGTPLPVVVQVFNHGTSPVTLRAMYLTDRDIASPALGDPYFKRFGVSYAPANNVIPPATTTTTSGSIPLPSGSGDPNTWIVIPYQTSSFYTIGSPPLVIGPLVNNIGYYGIDLSSNPPFIVPVYPSDNGVIANLPTPIFSGATNLTQALDFTPSLYNPDPNASQGSFFGTLNIQDIPPSSSLSNEFTYEWWSKLRTYGTPIAVAEPTTNRGTIWDTYGFFFIEGVGARISYLEDGKLWIGMSQDYAQQAHVPYAPYVGLSSSAPVPLNTWTHQAVTRNSSGQVTFWINGTGSGGGSRPFANNAHYIWTYAMFGNLNGTPYLNIDDPNDPFNGYIENLSDGYFNQFRFSNYCRYTSNFTPPTGVFGPTYGGGGGSVPITSSQTTAGSASFPALFTPQINPTPEYLTPSQYYEMPVGAVIVPDLSPNITIATSSLFRIQVPDGQQVSLLSPFALWSLHDNAIPPSNDGFAFQLTAQAKNPQTGEIITIPQNLCFFSSSDEGVASVVENSDGGFATTGSAFSSSSGFVLNPFSTQISASGGCVFINGTGSATLYLGIGFTPDSNNYIALQQLEVVDSLPVSININPPLQNVFSGSDYQYSAYLLKSNGSRVNITDTATWSVVGEGNIGAAPPYQLLGVTGSFGSLQINVESGSLSATAQAVIINRNF